MQNVFTPVHESGVQQNRRYSVCLLYWYKSTNTDAASTCSATPLYWYKSTNTDAASTCSAMNAAELPEGLDACKSTNTDAALVQKYKY